MVKHVLNWVVLLGLALLTTNVAFAQNRYVDKIFTEVEVTQDVPYAPQQISILTGVPDTIPLVCDIYRPVGDTASNRPVMAIAGTGNFLPRLLNGSPTGDFRDSAQVELAKELALRGYVAICYYYRQGWDALNDNVTAQTQSLLQATYRGIQDSRTLARWLRRNAREGGNTYGIDSSMIGIIGMGTGGYLAYAVNFLKDFDTELNLIKFQDPATGDPLVDTTRQSNLFGTTQTMLNIPNHVGYSSEFQVCVNIGGALGDSSWINPGEAPTISFHTTEDANAPYERGNVIVPTTGNVVIPDAAGSILVSKIQDRLGNNDIFKGLGLTDPYTTRAEMINRGYEGFFPFVLPDTGGFYDCFGTMLPLTPQGSPWTWWDEQTFIQQWDGAGLDTVFNASGVASNCNQRTSSPDMSPTKGRAYVDTLASFMAPRLYRVYSFVTSQEEVIPTSLNVYPNPASNVITISSTDTGNPIEEVSLMDQQGRLIYNSREGQGNMVRIRRQNWTRGLYIVRIQTNKGVVNKKLLLN